jgi:H+/Cl- antiporter ClcA
LNWIVGAPIALAVIAFAVANRQWIEVSFDPFSRETPFAAISMPLWALLFCGLFLGAVAGWIASWFAQKKWRKAARESRADVARLRDEVDALKRSAAEARERLPAPTEIISP